MDGGYDPRDDDDAGAFPFAAADYTRPNYDGSGFVYGNMPNGVFCGQDDGSGSFVCRNCGDTDFNLIVFDDSACKFISRCCGIVTDDDPVPPSCYKHVAAADVCIGRSGYDRNTHIHELIRQNMCMEPRISNDHFSEIVAAYTAETFAEDCSPKRRVQQVLRSLNDKHGVTFYTKRYLEKWKSIAHAIDGYEPDFDLCDGDRAIWSVEMDEFSKKFDELRWQKDPGIRGRKHVPNLRILARRIFDLHGVVYDPDDFPIPQTAACVKSNNEIINYVWSKMPNKSFI